MLLLLLSWYFYGKFLIEIQGVPKSKYWESVYEDSMDLIAKLPVIAATIYRNTYKGGKGVGYACLDFD